MDAIHQNLHACKYVQVLKWHLSVAAASPAVLRNLGFSTKLRIFVSHEATISPHTIMHMGTHVFHFSSHSVRVERTGVVAVPFVAAPFWRAFCLRARADTSEFSGEKRKHNLTHLTLRMHINAPGASLEHVIWVLSQVCRLMLASDFFMLILIVY